MLELTLPTKMAFILFEYNGVKAIKIITSTVKYIYFETKTIQNSLDFSFGFFYTYILNEKLSIS